jgi:hypothetical protein
MYRDVQVFQVSVGEPGDVDDGVDLFAVYSNSGSNLFGSRPRFC